MYCIIWNVNINVLPLIQDNFYLLYYLMNILVLVVATAKNQESFSQYFWQYSIIYWRPHARNWIILKISAKTMKLIRGLFILFISQWEWNWKFIILSVDRWIFLVFYRYFAIGSHHITENIRIKCTATHRHTAALLPCHRHTPSRYTTTHTNHLFNLIA